MEETAEVRLYSEVRLLAVPHLSYFDRFRRLNLAGLRFLVQCKQSCRTGRRWEFVVASVCSEVPEEADVRVYQVLVFELKVGLALRKQDDSFSSDVPQDVFDRQHMYQLLVLGLSLKGD